MLISDVLAGEDALDGLLDGPDRRDHRLVEDARPGVGEQDLRLERQAMEGMSHPAVEDVGATMIELQPTQRI
jgi:hypothetical protein